MTPIHCKIWKILKEGTFGGIKKFSKTSLTVPQKNPKGYPLVLSGFVCYGKNAANERRTLRTKLRFGWPVL